MSAQPNKKKIINDPIYGFISIPYDLVFDLIEHPWFQRLRRIRQLGLTYLVYPGALHTRFHHALGAMYLMGRAIEVLRSKGHEINEEEAEAVTIAILLHDMGHGPFSHALEHSLVSDIRHEDISMLFMEALNKEFKGRLSLAIDIFQNKYHKKFLHQLVSSQLDMDRLDYLKRDSFYSGVSEGVISSDRIISMLEVVNDRLAVESKGIYSVEKFLIARRLMYWQVYLHKTVLSAENLLVKILKRAKELAGAEVELFATPSFRQFLYHSFKKADFQKNADLLQTYSELDDNDIFASIKVWQQHSDLCLSTLCKWLVNRCLYTIDIQDSPYRSEEIDAIIKKAQEKLHFEDSSASYFVFTGKIENNAYSSDDDKINIRFKDGAVVDVAQASDNLNISALSRPVKKHYLCYPKGL